MVGGSKGRPSVGALLGSEEDFGGEGGGEVGVVREGVAEGFADGDGEHEGRFADCFGAVNGVVLCGVGEEVDAEVEGGVGEGGDGVGAGAVSEEDAVVVPLQIFAGEPTRSLHKGSFDLAAVEVGAEGVADIVENVDAAKMMHSGVAIDFHFADGGAESVVVEGAAFGAFLGPIPFEVGGLVESCRGKLDALGVSGVREFGEWDGVMAGMDAIVGEDDFGGVAFESLGGEGSEAFPQLAASIGDGHSIEVGAGGGGGGGGVGDLVGAGVHEADAVGGEPEFLHRDREDFAVEALAHFGAAVVHLHRAIGVDEDESAGLIVVFEGEADPEFDGGDGESASLLGVGLVPSLKFFLAGGEVGGLYEFVPDALDAVAFDDFTVVGGVGLAFAVIEVACAHLFGREVEREGDAGDDVLDDDHSLRSAKAPEGGVGGGVGFADAAFEVDVGKVVGVIEVEEGAVVDGEGEVEGPAAVGEEMDLNGVDAAVVLVAHLEAGVERVSLSRGHDVVVTIELEGDGLLELVGGEGAKGGPRIGLCFFATKAATHAGAFDGDAVPWPAEDFGDDGLGLGGVLGGRVNENGVFAIGFGEGGVGFEVELFLAADVEGAGELVGAVLEAFGDVTTSEDMGIGVERVGLDGGGDS